MILKLNEPQNNLQLDIDDKRVTFTKTTESTQTGDSPVDNLTINGYVVYEPVFASKSFNLEGVKNIDQYDRLNNGI